MAVAALRGPLYEDTMFQKFDAVSEGRSSAGRVERLRKELSALGLDGFVVPRSDEYQGEYVAGYAERLRWLTGFAGSAGVAIVLGDRAAIFVDGRYDLQAKEQVDGAVFELHHLIDEPPAQWLEGVLNNGQVIGYDPWLVTPEQVVRLETACAKAGSVLKPVESNPIDLIWEGQPRRPAGTVVVQPTQFAGRQPADKLQDIKTILGKAGADAAVLTLPDSIAWLFNIRGRDIARTPVVLCFAIVNREGPADLFLEQAKLTEHAAAHLENVAHIHGPDEFEPALAALGARQAAVLIDPASAPERVRAVLAKAGARIVTGPDPCILPKARKNPTEIEGARAAHRRDGVAMARFLAWLDAEAPKGELDEIAVVQRLEAFRAESGELMDLSFDTIAGTGPNAALPHYRVTIASNRRIEPDSIVLVDSGGQYQDGTTDITRTVIIGDPTEEMRDRFTRVLKGMIAISRLRFPKGTAGGHLDAFARHALWQAGFDYDHGTGHGVGSYLSVHEGPARLSKADRTVLDPGMLLSNEPGYYKQDHYGIRIENLIFVTEPRAIEGGERPMHGFETLTLAPIDRRLIEVRLLSPEERDWIDAYHARVFTEIGPLAEADVRNWLQQATAPLAG